MTLEDSQVALPDMVVRQIGILYLNLSAAQERILQLEAEIRRLNEVGKKLQESSDS